MITQVDNIPEELKKLKQWCVYSIVQPKKQGQHKGKIPINPVTNKDASSADYNTWVDFKTAVDNSANYDGLGFFFNDDYIGIDIDDIPEEIKKFSQAPTDPNNLINWLNSLINHSYLEVSQSGKGIHEIVKGKYDLNNNRRNNFEIYNRGRFFALTGNILNNQKNIKTVSKKKFKELYTSTVGKKKNNTPVDTKGSIPYGNNLSTDEIITKMFASDSGVKIKHLIDGEYDYNSQSEADIALCNYLAFWTNKDAAKMDAIFRQSKLMRDKWDRKDGAMTYGQRTINKAILDTQNGYSTSGDAPNVYNPSSENTGNYIFSFNEKKQKPKLINYPDWVYIDKKNKAHAYPSLLGKFLLNQNKNKWLITKDDDKNEFWIYKKINITDGKEVYVWQLDNIKNLRGYIHSELDKANLWTSRVENDTYKYIVGALQDPKNIKEKSKTFDADRPNLIPFINGVFNIKTMEVLPYSPHYYFTDCAPYKISENANQSATLTNKWFDETFKKNATTVKEYIGYMFFNTYEMFQAFMILKGNGGEGKTTITNYISSLLPESWVFNASLEALTKSEKNGTNFNIAELKGKYLNLNQDISDDYIQDPSKVKNLTGWDWLTAQIKGQQKQTRFRNHAKLLFACNGLPSSFDVSGGMTRRLYVIDAFTISGFSNKYDMNKINEERGVFVRECIQACKDRYKHEIEHNVDKPQLTLTKSIQFHRNKWLTDNSVVRRWAEECIIPQEELKKLNWSNEKKNRGVKETYNAFVTWCKNNNEPKIPIKTKFNDALEEIGFHHRKMHFKTSNIHRWENLALFQDNGNIGTV